MATETPPNLVASAATKIIDWYWSYGSRRKGVHLLSAGSWLNTVYQAKKMASRMENLPTTKRKAMALWGPSQSGKSTLLSAFIDRPNKGKKSALQWSDSEPVEFVGGEGNSVKLNPYNFQNDASGCVSRFILSEDVADPDFPVEFVLATPDQLLQALAIGYMTECAGVWERVLTAEELEKLLEEANSGYYGESSDRTAYEFLHDLTVVLDDLLLADWPRFIAIKPRWIQIRSAILESAALRSNEQRAKRFVTAVLWNGEQRLLSTYEDLLSLGKKIRAAKRLWATYGLTAQVLDISSAVNYVSRAIEPIYVNEESGEFKFAFKKGTKRLVSGALEFARFQALIWEIRIPLNAAVLRETSPEVASALETTDFVDFPGVSREGDGGTKPHLDKYGDLELFTNVFKRGKTASVVVSYANSLAIDGFSLLMRSQSPLAQPRQIRAGLTAWTKALGLEWPPIHDGPPLNIVLTFCAKLIEDVQAAVASNRNLDGVTEIFTWFESIRGISDPRWAKFWATSYPRFETDGKISGNRQEALVAASHLMNFKAFKERFAHSPTNLAIMVEASLTPEGDGGVHEFLGAIAGQLSGSLLAKKRQVRLKDLWGQIQALCEDAFPSHATNEATRASDIKMWQKALVDRISERQQLCPEEDATASVAAALMRVMTVSGEKLDLIPSHAGTNAIDNYVAQQVSIRWLDHARDERDALSKIALDDPASFNRRMEYLADHVLASGELVGWVQKQFGRLSRPEDLSHHRQYLALRLSDLLLYGSTKKRVSHRLAKDSNGKPSEVFKVLTALAQHEAQPAHARRFEETAHFAGVVQPFLMNLDAVANGRARSREKQPGDAEMAAIQKSLELIYEQQ